MDTEGLPNIHVLQEHREVGRTDAKGRLLVPDMRSFDVNRVAIDATDVPLDVTINTDMQEFRPQDRSGVIVRFPVKVSHAALVRMVDETGVPLPVGSTATVQFTRTSYPVGYEGEAYLENLSPHNGVQVELPNGHHCSVSFVYLPVHGTIPTIGPLLCQEARP